MKNKNTQKLTLAAMVAAAYAVLSLLGAVFGITYGPIQVRFSEALCLLPFLFPETAWGLGVGCLIANLFSPYGVVFMHAANHRRPVPPRFTGEPCIPRTEAPA